MQNRFKFRCFFVDEKKMYFYDYFLPAYIMDEKQAYIMQCTGLKDKNGKLIYEGDLVKKYTFVDSQGDGQFIPDVYVDREYIGVVHFTASNGATIQRLKIYETDDPYEPKKQRDKRDCPKATKLVAYRSEVIGNIYETPELLEVQNEPNK